MLSRIESNSANCSMVREEMAGEGGVEAALGGGGGGVVAGEGGGLMPRAWGGTVTSLLPCRMIQRPVALCTNTLMHENR